VQFNTALTQARRDGRADREAYAREHLEALVPRLSRLTVQVPAAARVPGLVVKLDGVAMGPALWGTAAPVVKASGVGLPASGEAGAGGGDGKRTAAYVSDVGIALGVVGLGVGTYLFFTSGSGQALGGGHGSGGQRGVPVAHRLTPDAWSLAVGGGW
jgi:hypothetical protein